MYLFVSCKKNRHRWGAIRRMCDAIGIDDYVILCGSNRTRLSGGKVLYLNCPDDYAGLPAKMKVAFQTCHRMFPRARGFVKVDDDVLLTSRRLGRILSAHPFAGCAINRTADQRGTWHLGRCPGSAWDSRPFDAAGWNAAHLGIAGSVRYPSGGHVYHVSRACCGLIARSKIDPGTHIWEDAFIGAILHAAGVKVARPPGVRLYTDDSIRLNGTVLCYVDRYER